MDSATELAIRAENKALGLRTKNKNLIAALLSGFILVTISVSWLPPSATGFSLGLLAGIIYANGFEYCLHRYLMHGGDGIVSRQHRMHHATLRASDAATYVLFSRNPLAVAALVGANALPFFLLEWITRNGWAAGAHASFALYYIAFEEIHWRSHMGGRLPAWLRASARHHLRHHASDNGHFNIFLPLFDRLASIVSHTGSCAESRRSQSGWNGSKLKEGGGRLF